MELKCLRWRKRGKRMRKCMGAAVEERKKRIELITASYTICSWNHAIFLTIRLVSCLCQIISCKPNTWMHSQMTTSNVLYFSSNLKMFFSSIFPFKITSKQFQFLCIQFELLLKTLLLMMQFDRLVREYGARIYAVSALDATSISSLNSPWITNSKPEAAMNTKKDLYDHLEQLCIQ